ncbi:MAG: recombinase family protein [Candidatus Bathyarchaeia archaeon]
MGLRVAAYLRVSTGKQAKDGMSLEVQKELIENMKNQLKSLSNYWFVDLGKSGRDFDGRFPFAKTPKIIPTKHHTYP